MALRGRQNRSARFAPAVPVHVRKRGDPATEVDDGGTSGESPYESVEDFEKSSDVQAPLMMGHSMTPNRRPGWLDVMVAWPRWVFSQHRGVVRHAARAAVATSLNLLRRTSRSLRIDEAESQLVGPLQMSSKSDSPAVAPADRRDTKPAAAIDRTPQSPAQAAKERTTLGAVNCSRRSSTPSYR